MSHHVVNLVKQHIFSKQITGNDTCIDLSYNVIDSSDITIIIISKAARLIEPRPIASFIQSNSRLPCGWHLVMVGLLVRLSDLTSYAGWNLHVPDRAIQVTDRL